MWGWAKKHVYVLRVGFVCHVSGGWVDDMVWLSGAYNAVGREDGVDVEVSRHIENDNISCLSHPCLG